MSEYSIVVINWAVRAKPAGLSFLIVNLDVPWTLPINQCSRGIVLNVYWSSSLEGDYHTAATSNCAVTNVTHNYYVYMSSDGPPKRDSPFWRHWTVRFTCLLKSFTCGRRVGKHVLCRVVNQGLYSVELESNVHWCTDFRNLAIAVHASHEVGAVNYGSCCTL